MVEYDFQINEAVEKSKRSYKIWMVIDSILSATFLLDFFVNIFTENGLDLNDKNQTIDFLLFVGFLFVLGLKVIDRSIQDSILKNLVNNRVVIGRHKVFGYYSDKLSKLDNVIYFEEEIENIKAVETLPNEAIKGRYGNGSYNLAIYCKNKTYKFNVTKNQEAKETIQKAIDSIGAKQ